jgi:hypothetical protein
MSVHATGYCTDIQLVRSLKLGSNSWVNLSVVLFLMHTSHQWEDQDKKLTVNGNWTDLIQVLEW